MFVQAPVSALRLLWPPYGTLATKLLEYLAR
jgi:hypothetical protein